ncbi:helix-turn-helix domain-containing protein [Streptomyces sp. JB150]|uniref:helix-turn-helix domain-containing protein n=1 Tax=Streptomyces sp. JB150 TaxID=2714844 RepID=UPI0014084314|nr:helix-turn-helix domain-containing protein [Streptomyces sp. JB150]QIJ61059.1 helix-turn-helix domain-containing protein [Streptomyces sp. JB150]
MLRTPGNDTRLRILEWLKEPAAHFPHHPTDPVGDGVPADAVAAKLGVPRPVAETHLALLAALGLLRTHHVRGRVHYRRDDMRIAEVARIFEKGW